MYLAKTFHHLGSFINHERESFFDGTIFADKFASVNASEVAHIRLVCQCEANALI